MRFYYFYATACSIAMMGVMLLLILWSGTYPEPKVVGGSAYPAPLELSEVEKAQIIEYMKGLDSDGEHTDK